MLVDESNRRYQNEEAIIMILTGMIKGTFPRINYMNCHAVAMARRKMDLGNSRASTRKQVIAVRQSLEETVQEL